MNQDPLSGRHPRRDPDAGRKHRVLLDAVLPPATGLAVGAAVGAVLAAVDVADADWVLLIGIGAAIGVVGGVLLSASRGFKLRAPGHSEEED